MIRKASVSTLLTGIDPERPEPLHTQLYGGMKALILTGRIAAGTRVPSTRSLAADLELSRTTILTAFDQLLAEGLLEARPASGTYVADRLPGDTKLLTRCGDGPCRPSGKVTLSRRAETLLRIPIGGRALGPVPRAFRLGTPALDEFPIVTWSRIVAKRARSATARMLDYRDTGGQRALREAIVEHVAASRGVRASWDQVLITAGAQPAVDFAARMLLNEGDEAWLEDPGYLGARAAFRSAGVKVVSVPVDADGLRVDVGLKRAPHARMAYVTPSHQYPTGGEMALRRRLDLLRWAGEENAWIMEDDYDSEFRFAGRPLPSLQGLDAMQRVLYVGTFSKTLFPGLRLGFLIVPDALVDAFAQARMRSEQFLPALEQTALADFIAEGHFARHLRRMRSVYRERYEALAGAAERYASGLIDIVPTNTGMHALANVAPGYDADTLMESARARGIEVTSTTPYTIEAASRRNALLLGYGSIDPNAIVKGVQALVECAG